MRDGVVRVSFILLKSDRGLRLETGPCACVYGITVNQKTVCFRGVRPSNSNPGEEGAESFQYAIVAQLVRASPCQGEGHEFESHLSLTQTNFREYEENFEE